MNVLTLFGWLCVAHVVTDYPLQGDFLARAKNHRAPVSGFPWYQALGAHALMHGGAVALLTGSVALGAAEMLLHVLIDYAKCDGHTSLNTDQALHVACKLAWALLAGGMAAGMVHP